MHLAGVIFETCVSAKEDKAARHCLQELLADSYFLRFSKLAEEKSVLEAQLAPIAKAV